MTIVCQWRGKEKNIEEIKKKIASEWRQGQQKVGKEK